MFVLKINDLDVNKILYINKKIINKKNLINSD